MTQFTICRGRFRQLLAMAAAVALTGCASQPTQSPTGAERAVDQAVQDQKAAQAQTAPDSVTDQLLQPGAAQPDGAAAEEERFDIAVNRVPARSFFLGLVDGTAINMVVHPDVEGVISLELNDVSLEEVLAVTREVFGYEFSKNGNIYTIHPRTLRTEVFAIDYLDVKRKGVSNTNLSVGNITSGSNRSNNNRGGNNNDDDGERAGSGARIETRSDTDFWQTLDASLKAIVQVNAEDGEPRMVMVNAQTGMVVVRALPSELSAVRNFLKQSELSVGRQVILETKIIEVKLDDGYQSGIDWSHMQGQAAYNYEWVNSDITTPNEYIDRAFNAIFSVSDISKFIQFLETQGRVQVLSSPRVSTVNNQKAIIRVGSDEFFVTGISNSTTASAGATTQTPTVELDSFFSGIALDVTPQIAENGDVILHVHPVISEVTDQVKELTVGNEEFSLPLALRDVRESDSIVRAKDGQVIVLGGLMQEIEDDRVAQSPWLGNIPGLNALFKRRNDSKQKTELVILMRPMVATDETWNNDLRGTQQRLRDLEAEYRSQLR